MRAMGECIRRGGRKEGVDKNVWFNKNNKKQNKSLGKKKRQYLKYESKDTKSQGHCKPGPSWNALPLTYLWVICVVKHSEDDPGHRVHRVLRVRWWCERRQIVL